MNLRKVKKFVKKKIYEATLDTLYLIGHHIKKYKIILKKGWYILQINHIKSILLDTLEFSEISKSLQFDISTEDEIPKFGSIEAEDSYSFEEECKFWNELLLLYGEAPTNSISSKIITKNSLEYPSWAIPSEEELGDMWTF